MRFESISRNDNGDFYIIYSYPTIQQIGNGTKCKKDGKRELLIHGVPKTQILKVWNTIFDNCDED